MDFSARRRCDFNVPSTRIKTIADVATRSCACESWLKHWKKFSVSAAGICPVVSCSNVAEIGAHVHKGWDSQEYILPLCHAHHGVTEILLVNSHATFISADPYRTCRKSS